MEQIVVLSLKTQQFTVCVCVFHSHFSSLDSCYIMCVYMCCCNLINTQHESVNQLIIRLW